MNKINAVVIDDEINIRSLIIKLITELNDNFRIIGQAHGVKSGFTLINELRPQVVFLDIKMTDGTGFELLSLFETINFDVVFISGFDNYALNAFEFNALDYVLKPIDSRKFTKTLHKVANNIINKQPHLEELKTIVNAYNPGELLITKIPVHTGNKVMLLDIHKILYIKADAGSSVFMCEDNQRFVSARQLGDFEFILENYPAMIRVNRSIYVNLQYITSYSKGFTCYLYMKDGFEIEIPRRKKTEILNLINQSKQSSND